MAGTGFHLHDLLAPKSEEEFFSQSWGRDFLLIEGDHDKFDGLLSWQEVNRVLSEHRLEPPRLRLAHSKRGADQLDFINQRPTRRSGDIPRIDLPALYSHLSDGATLIIDSIDEVVPSISQTAENLTGSFRTHIQANMYAAWRQTEGFGIHWDDHDVLIVQVAGRKSWRIYGVTRRHPLYRDIEQGEQPTHTIWEGALTPGDILYLPRGMWHAARGLDEPTLHVTIGINNPTGLDLFTWLGDRLRSEEIFRRDIPRFSSPEIRREHSVHLRDALLRALRDDIVDDFLTHRDSSIGARPHFSLPFAVDSIPKSCSLTFSGVAFVVSEDSEESFCISSLGQEWSFAADAKPLIKSLLETEGLPVREAETIGRRIGIDKEDLNQMLESLVKSGLIHVTPE